jgi:hypothetical protein
MLADARGQAQTVAKPLQVVAAFEGMDLMLGKP